ncbi:MAG TPA: PAS domain S-box protein [Beijerinckiaceae bacterium]
MAAPSARGDHATLIAEIARLLRSGRDWTGEIDRILAALGEGLGLSRVYIFQVHEVPGAGLGQTCRADWAAPGLNALASDARNIDEDLSGSDPTFHDWTERRRRGEMIEVFTRDLDGYLRQDYEYQRILSCVSMPIMVNGQWWGHLGFDDCETERRWSAAEKSVLTTVAYLLGNAIELSPSSLVMSEATRVAMLSTAPDGIIIIDEAGCVLEFNPAAETIFGHSRKDVLGRRLGPLIVPAEMQEMHEIGFRRYLQGGAARMLGRRVETEGVHSDGRRIPIELAITEIKVENRRLFAAYIRDLTERKATEAELTRQREQLHHSEKLAALGSLLAGVAHELNNPLAIVVAQTSLLHEKAKDPDTKARAEKLRAAADRCGRIVKSFLAMVRRTPPSRKDTDVNNLVQATVEMTAYGARSAGIIVSLDLDPSLPKVSADTDQIGQVVANILINAQQALLGQQGERRIAVSTRAEGDAVVVTVQDNGPGVAPGARGRIFEPYFTTKPLGAGTGIGLSVSLNVVKSHGGDIRVEDVEPHGARFVVTLPIGHSTQVEATGPITLKARSRSAVVIDDEPDVAATLAEILEGKGIATRVFTATEAAEPAIAAALPDVIFCDLRMPGIGGIAFHREVIARHPVMRDRFVLITGDTVGVSAALAEPDIDPGLKVLEKPFTLGDVDALLQRIG